MLAITVSDGKAVLAYSTISNLGLIAACAGVGRQETVWAAVLLLIFHAVSKSLLFQTVGAIENATGSRDIESMHGLIARHPRLALTLSIGIAGMFLAPFGMLISKWAALKPLWTAAPLSWCCLSASAPPPLCFTGPNGWPPCFPGTERTPVKKHNLRGSVDFSAYSLSTNGTAVLCIPGSV